MIIVGKNDTPTDVRMTPVALVGRRGRREPLQFAAAFSICAHGVRLRSASCTAFDPSQALICNASCRPIRSVMQRLSPQKRWAGFPSGPQGPHRAA